jgi:hypothetical protein
MRITFGFLVMMACVAAGLSQDAKTDPKLIVQRAITAHGGEEALKAYTKTSSKGKGTMTVYGLEMPFTSEVTFVAPDKLRMEMNAEVGGQKMAMLQIMNGDKFLQTTNGKKTPIGDVEKKELVQAAMMQDIATLVPLLSGKYTLKLEKDEKIGEDDMTVISVEARDFRTVKCSFDKKTGYLIRTSRKGFAPGDKGPREVLEETQLSDFKKVENVMIAGKMIATHDGKPFMTMTLSEGKVLKTVDEKLFTVGD